MKIITVNTANPYKIYIDEKIACRLNSYLTKLNLGNIALIVTSRSVHRIYSQQIVKSFGKIAVKFVILPDGEGAKNEQNLFKIAKEALKADGWGKKLFFVALGGGTIGDVTGFAAAIYKRGTSYINIPTTFLAQIDSSIGGKTAIDLKEAKNILGAFHQPSAVFIDTGFLKTLRAREIAQGSAEAIKYGVIYDKKLFDFLGKNHRKVAALERNTILRIIAACVEIKASIVSRDPLEKKGLRTILNFGHTFGHALETSLRYRSFSHGEAIAIGMIYAANLSVIMGRCSRNDLSKIIHIIKKFSLPITVNMGNTDFRNTMKHDKKFTAGKTRMVLLKAIGKVEICNDIPDTQLCQAFDIFGANSRAL
jgi:3-dehydroquinate synthase